MNMAELREILTVMRWSQRELARIVGISEGVVRKWARGAAPVPEYVGKWLRTVSAPIKERPFPKQE